MIHNISRFIAALALLATAQGAWAWSGSGTAESPYQIKSTADLDQLATEVNSGTTEHEGDYFVLTTDLTYSHETDWNDASSTENNFTPIGGQYDQQWRYFNGHFDGQGHTISGIRIYKSGDTTAEQCMGLFGRIDGAEVKNVFLADARITANDNCGPIVGYNRNGRVENCHVLSDVTVHAVASGADYHGGVVGYNVGTITGCTSAASITAAVSFKYNGGITGSGSGTVEDCIYFGSTVAGDSYVGAIIGYASSGSTIRNCYYINDGIASAIGYKKSDATVTDARLATSDDFAVSGDTYTIGTAAGWSVMCAALYHNDTYNRFSGKTVRLGADITVTRMAGSGDNPFCGNFDGGGNTLTFTATAADNYCAPFVGVKGGTTADDATTISNLNVVTTITANDYRHMAGLIALQWGHVNVSGINATVNISSTVGTSTPHDLYPAALVSQASSSDGGTLTVTGCTTSGTISTDGKYAAGLVGIVQGTASISDCVSSVTIQSTTSGDGTHGGLVASQPSGTTITITGCVFDGSLLGSTTNSCGGFIGYRKGAAGIYNSLFVPTEVTVKKDNSATFARNDVDTHNCYYTYYLCDGEHYVPYYATDGITRRNGHATRTVAAADDVTIDAVALTGTPIQYTVSGITAYSGGGLQRGETLYYGSGDQLSLTLSNTATPAPRGYQYAYTASAGTLSGSTLTMPDQDVTISVNTADLAPIDWATVNQGNSADPYMIYNKDQLLLLAHRVNGTNGETANTYEGKYFKLGADITFSHAAVEGDDYAENYVAIGGYYNGTNRYFKGNFDGDGHTVSGIRIRKTGSGNADNYQGLFGCISSGANIYDVHLTDARITGYNSVGGIVGGMSVPLNGSGVTVSGCSVTDSYITATSSSYGIICGSNTRGYSDGTLRNNYYHGCTVNGTAVTSGKGCGIGNNLAGFSIADLTANNGALPAYRLDLGANITTPPGTFVGQEEWLDTPPVSPRLDPGNGFTLAGNHYFASGYVFTPGSTLASGAAQGYTPRATLGDELLDPYTPTGDADPLAGKAIAQFTITADCDGKTLASTEAIYSTGQPVTVAYIKADGTTGEASAIALDGTETSLAAGWYFVGKDISYTATVNLTGDVHLILADGCTMNIGTSESRISGNGIRRNGEEQSLTIYSQSLGDDMGELNIYTDNGNNGIVAKAVTINGGNVTIDANGNWATGIYAALDDITINGGTVSATATGNNARAIYALNNVTINGGTVEASGTADGIRIDNGTIAINGGTVNASGTEYGINAYYGYLNITLGWTRPADRITVSSYSGTVTLARLFTDATDPAAPDPADNYYGGTYTAAALNALAGKTLSGTETFDLGVTLAPKGYGTYYDSLFDITLPTGTQARIVTARGDTDGTLSYETIADGDDSDNNTVPGGTAVMLYHEGGGSVTLTIHDDRTLDTRDFTQASGNDGGLVSLLHGSDVATTTTGGSLYYKLTYGSVEGHEDIFGWYWGAEDGAAFTSPAHKAWLALDAAGTEGSGENARAFIALPEETLGISEELRVKSEEFAAARWYTLDGRKLDKQPTKAGMYIHGGRKVMVK